MVKLGIFEAEDKVGSVNHVKGGILKISARNLGWSDDEIEEAIQRGKDYVKQRDDLYSQV